MSGEPDRSTSARALGAIPATNIARIGPGDQSWRIVGRRFRSLAERRGTSTSIAPGTP
jgi:hypothetical protein